MYRPNWRKYPRKLDAMVRTLFILFIFLSLLPVCLSVCLSACLSIGIIAAAAPTVFATEPTRRVTLLQPKMKRRICFDCVWGLREPEGCEVLVMIDVLTKARRLEGSHLYENLNNNGRPGRPGPSKPLKSILKSTCGSGSSVDKPAKSAHLQSKTSTPKQ